jgi:hypothetical protein
MCFRPKLTLLCGHKRRAPPRSDAYYDIPRDIHRPLWDQTRRFLTSCASVGWARIPFDCRHQFYRHAYCHRRGRRPAGLRGLCCRFCACRSIAPWFKIRAALSPQRVAPCSGTSLALHAVLLATACLSAGGGGVLSVAPWRAHPRCRELMETGGAGAAVDDEGTAHGRRNPEAACDS